MLQVNSLNNGRVSRVLHSFCTQLLQWFAYSKRINEVVLGTHSQSDCECRSSSTGVAYLNIFHVSNNYIGILKIYT